MINSSVSNSTSNIDVRTSLEALDLSHTSIVQRLYREYSTSVHSHKFPEVKELRGMDQSSQPFFGKNESKHSGADDMAAPPATLSSPFPIHVVILLGAMCVSKERTVCNCVDIEKKMHFRVSSSQSIKRSQTPLCNPISVASDTLKRTF